MQDIEFPYKFIAIEGNIGAGKTTLCKKIARDFDVQLILEQFTDNPFLPLFYQHPERYAFQVELFFMTERHKQLQYELTQQPLFGQPNIIADYFFVKTMLFAKQNLKADELRLFQQLFETFNPSFPNPDLLIYLHRPVDQLLKNIEKRGRSIEEHMDPNYLVKLQNSYFDYFKNVVDYPVVLLDLEKVDFENNQDHYHIILDCIRSRYRDGFQQVRILN